MTKLIEGSPNQELKNNESAHLKEQYNTQNAVKAEKKPWRKKAAAAGTLLAIAGCDMLDSANQKFKNFILTNIKPDIEEGVVYEKYHVTERSNLPFSYIPEQWVVSIAKCPPGKDPIKEGITEGCRVNGIGVSEDIYNRLKIGQYADLKKSERY